MKITVIKSHQEIVEPQKTVLVLGYFDALHTGHKALFDKAKEVAKKKE